VIDALLVLQAGNTGVAVAELLEVIGASAAEADVLAALDSLRDRALCWGDSVVRVAAEAGTALPWQPGQVTMEDRSRTGEQLVAAVAEVDEEQREVLERLATESPLGRTRDAAAGAPVDHPVPQLLAAGLLRRVDDETVILPRLVGQVVRGEQPGPIGLVAPDPTVSQTTATDADAAAAGAVIDLLRELDALLETLGRTPVPELRTGGLGIREIKRLAKATGVSEPRLGLLLEIAYAAGLIAVGYPDPEPDDERGDSRHFAPTLSADRFADLTTAQRWQTLAGTWLELSARPGLIGSRGPDGKTCGALSTSPYYTAAALDRRLLLGMLADLPGGAGVDSSTASASLVWRRPRWARRLQPGPVAELLDEAHALGLVGRGAISSPGRAGPGPVS
jgi:hypothetical protein